MTAIDDHITFKIVNIFMPNFLNNYSKTRAIKGSGAHLRIQASATEENSGS
jgi:hypothetical protein